MSEAETWRARFERERAARREAEDLLNDKSRELYRTNESLAARVQELANTLQALAEANTRLEAEKATRERVEAELRLAQRLEAVGQLAAGVAHEINSIHSPNHVVNWI